jgi:hypothetical protein
MDVGADKAPRFGGATHANGHDNRSRYCEVVFQVHGVDSEGNAVLRRQLKRRYVVAFFQKLPCLFLLTKYPIIEYLDFEGEATAIVGRLRDNPRYWNSPFLWRDQIEVRYLQHEADYLIIKDYAARSTRILISVRSVELRDPL